jgi:hypothetical protein
MAQAGGAGVPELATRRAVPRELGPFRVNLDRPGGTARGLLAAGRATGSAGKSETANAPAAPAVTGGVVSRCALFGRLAGAERVVQISAPAGSGKTVLVRSWIAEAGLAERAGWVPVGRDERDPRRFWIGVADAAGSVLAMAISYFKG